MDPSRIAHLLSPFLGDPATAPSHPLTSWQLDQISMYIDLLLRWNARINLTAIRAPEEIVTRHFGESLFAARHLLPHGTAAAPPSLFLDLGSGAGFPGLPLKIWSPQTKVTLIESNQKKVAFLREVIRALTLTNINVFPGRAEDFPPATANLLTLRAVERFQAVLPTALTLLAPAARLALLIGEPQVTRAQALIPTLHWSRPIAVPQSTSRVLLIGKLRHSPPEPTQ